MTSHARRSTFPSLLLRGAGTSILLIFLVWLSIATSFLLVGFLLFGWTASQQLQLHVGLAFGEARKSRLPTVVGTLMTVLAVATAFFWVEQVTRALHPSSDANRIAMFSLPCVFIIVGWVLAPFVFAAVLAVDARGPSGLRRLSVVALRVTQEIPARRRLLALVAAASTLFAPLLASLVFPSIDTLLLSGWLLIAVSAFLPIASALLVSTYAGVRDDLHEFEGRLPRAPSGLVVFAMGCLCVSILAVLRGTPTSMLVLLVLWLAIAHAASVFVRAHQLRRLENFREGLPPGRHAFEGSLRIHGSDWREGARVVAGDVFLNVAPDARVVGNREDLIEGTKVTVVGDFTSANVGFREGAARPWPKRAQLVVGTLDRVIDRTTLHATRVAYTALTAASVFAAITAAG